MIRSTCGIISIDTSPMKFLLICVILVFIVVSELLANTEDHDCTDIQQQCDEEYYAKDTRIPYNFKMTIQHGHRVWKKCNFVTGFMFDNEAMDCLAICDRYMELTGHPDTVSRKKRDVSNCYPGVSRCDPYARYRTITGECNNLLYPEWGRSDRIQNRFLYPTYDDGIMTPRVVGHCHGPLPAPRYISNIVHQSNIHSDYILTEKHISYLVMQWGQFLAHDIILTPLEDKANGSSIDCCGEDAGNPFCMPIGVPYRDPHFNPYTCMNFVRSRGQMCQGVRRQINEQTSYIDASNVYGANARDEALMKTGGGLLLSIGGKLGMDMDDSVCQLSRAFDPDNYFCLRAGDARVNEQPGLISIHTLFQREHNRIATALHHMNPHWSNFTVYQEARKIVAAEMQLITYKEWLPKVLGWKTVKNSGLYITPTGYYDTYDEYTDATIANELGSAILRFGHSLIHDFIGTRHAAKSEAENLDDHFFDPEMYHRYHNYGTDYIMHWMSSITCPFADRVVQGSARNTLFLDKDGKSFDIAALNIQRGRDHGLPSYNDAREHFGLGRAKHFGKTHGGLVDHDPDIALLLNKAYYGCVDNIDLFTGALTERRLTGAITGPLQQKILVETFRNLRNGDRFWFERHDRLTGFTERQLNSLKRTGLSSVMCANTQIPWIQENAFSAPTNKKRHRGSKVIDCHHIPRLDLSLWSERISHYDWPWNTW